jgi:hypothetical protein
MSAVSQQPGLPMDVRRLFFLAAALCIMSAPAAAQTTKPVVELFTSQGCNSCPPADAVIGQLANDPNVIALTLSVDYWDYLGWKDTLAISAHTQRQKNYARVRGDMNVYTPQAVVNGVKYMIGSDRTQIQAALRQPAGDAVPLKIRREGERIEVEIGAGKGNATIWVISVTHRVPVQITRGENRGATITYFNVVRAWHLAGEYTGVPMKVSIPVSDMTKSGGDTVVVLVQSGSATKPGAIRSAELLELR